MECIKGDIEASNETHLDAHSLSEFSISRIAFSSCIRNKLSNILYYPGIWEHVRYKFKPDLWIWLGDNAYSDGKDMNYKREKYNEIREDEYYRKYGPIGNPKIPVMGIWDDHDFGYNGVGKEYPCAELSQREFCIHFNISKKDARHPDYEPLEGKRSGIYSSLTFANPEPYNVNDVKGIHVINLDTTSHRDVLYRRGNCSLNGVRPENVDFIDKEQWNWLSNELFNVKSEIKIISSSIQALTPTNFNVDNDMYHYCAYDGEDGEFVKGVKELGEEKKWHGGGDFHKEKWADAPRARAKLLQWVQKSINMNMTKVVIFLSGNLHFGDLLAKRMPESSVWGASQVLYEVVSSGIGQKARNWAYRNAARIRLRTCDKQGNGVYFKECKFPFEFKGKTRNKCITNLLKGERDGRPWCFYDTNKKNIPNLTKWGYCLPENQELVKRKDQYVSGLTCSNHYHQTCGVNNVYGGVAVDWKNGIITLSVYNPNPFKMNQTAASAINVSFLPEWKIFKVPPDDSNHVEEISDSHVKEISDSHVKEISDNHVEQISDSHVEQISDSHAEQITELLPNDETNFSIYSFIIDNETNYDITDDEMSSILEETITTTNMNSKVPCNNMFNLPCTWNGKLYSPKITFNISTNISIASATSATSTSINKFNISLGTLYFIFLFSFLLFLKKKRSCHNNEIII